jgi:hypothetical protein
VIPVAVGWAALVKVAELGTVLFALYQGYSWATAGGDVSEDEAYQAVRPWFVPLVPAGVADVDGWILSALGVPLSPSGRIYQLKLLSNWNIYANTHLEPARAFAAGAVISAAHQAINDPGATIGDVAISVRSVDRMISAQLAEQGGTYNAATGAIAPGAPPVPPPAVAQLGAPGLPGGSVSGLAWAAVGVVLLGLVLWGGRR